MGRSEAGGSGYRKDMDLPQHIVMLGLMGSGKTTVGRQVAQRLERPLVDSDAWIEERTGMTVAALWHRGGEAAYRPHEREVVTQTLAGNGPDVLSAPAGVVTDRVAVASLEQPGVFRVWLRADAATLAERVRFSSHRPLLDGDAEAVLAQQARERAPLYEELADVILDVEGSSPTELADRVIEAIGAAPATPHQGRPLNA